MAGLTREMIFEAADAMLSRGGRVTNEAVLAELGSGSMSTITKHLREWRQIQRESIPQSNDNLADRQAEPVYDIKPDDIPAVQQAITDIKAVLFNTVSSVVSEQRAAGSTLQRAMQADFNAKIEQAQQVSVQQAETLNAKIAKTIEEYEDNLAAASGHVDQLAEALRERDATLQHLRAEKGDVEVRLASVIDERNAARIENATLSEKLHGTSEACQRLNNHNVELEETIVSLTASIKQHEQAENTAVAQRDSALAEVARLRPYEAETSAQRLRADDAKKQVAELNSEMSALNEKVLKYREEVVALERDINYTTSELIRSNTLVTTIQTEKAALIESAKADVLRADKAEKAHFDIVRDLKDVRNIASTDKAAYTADVQRLSMMVATYEKTAVEVAAAHQKALDSQRSDYCRTIEVLQSAIGAFRMAQSAQSDKPSAEVVVPEPGLAR